MSPDRIATSRWPLLLALVLASVGGCATRGLVVEPPPPPDAVAVSGPPIRIGIVQDARAFGDSAFYAPQPSTSRDPADAAWTRRVFGRRRTDLRTLGGDWYTSDPAGVPALVRASLTNGLVAAGHPASTSEATPPDAGPRLDAVIESFWIHEAFRSQQARLVYEAEVSVTGSWPGFESPIRLRARGTIGAGAADGVLWRRAMGRTLEQLAAALTGELQRHPPVSPNGPRHQEGT